MPGAATLLRDVFGFDAFRPGQERNRRGRDRRRKRVGDHADRRR